jgi:hypothetical protein
MNASHDRVETSAVQITTAERGERLLVAELANLPVQR